MKYSRYSLVHLKKCCSVAYNLINMFTFNKAKYDLELESPQDMYVGGGKEIIRLIFGTVKIITRFSENDTLLDCQT